MGWMALMAPPGTPQAIAEKISSDVRTVQALPELQKRLSQLGNYTRPTTPAELTVFIREQIQIWRPVIADTAAAIR
jgi:tripartite-type tricarboxylate transporter receptor subunit TctC